MADNDNAPQQRPAGEGGTDAGQRQDDTKNDAKTAATEPATGTGQGTGDGAGDGAGDDKPLGAAGQRALEAERAKVREAEKRAREAEKKVKQFEDANKSDLEKAAGRAEQAEQRAQALIERTVRAEVRAAAADSFADPDDAAAFLDLAGYVDDDGEIDTGKIKTDLADLLKRKPHLGRTPERKSPRPDPSQGTRPGGTPDLAAQIAQARAKGDWRAVMRLENSKLANLPQ